MSAPRIRYCSVLSCQNTSQNYDGSFFRLPNDPKRCELWVENLGALKQSHVRYVCRDHFDDTSFVDTFKCRLHRHSVPRKASAENPTSHESLTTSENPSSHEKLTTSEKPTSMETLTSEESLETCKRISLPNEASNSQENSSITPLTLEKRTLTNSNDKDILARKNELYKKITLLQSEMSVPNIRYCSVLSCQNTSQNYDGSFFRIPKEPERKQLWVENLGALKQSYVRYVCRDHFDDNSFVDTFKKRLLRNSAPRKVSSDGTSTSQEKPITGEKRTCEEMLKTDETFAYERLCEPSEVAYCFEDSINPDTSVKRNLTHYNDEETSARKDELLDKKLKVQQSKSPPKFPSEKSSAMVIVAEICLPSKTSNPQGNSSVTPLTREKRTLTNSNDKDILARKNELHKKIAQLQSETAVTNMRYCSVLSCQNTSRNYDGTFFRLPQDPKRRQLWIENLGALKAKHVKFVCRNHFDDNSFVDTFKKRLLLNSAPRKVSTDGTSTSQEKLTVGEKSTCKEMLTTDETYAYERLCQPSEVAYCLEDSIAPDTSVKRNFTHLNEEETSVRKDEQSDKKLKVQQDKSPLKSQSEKSLAMVIYKLKKKKCPNLFLKQTK